MSRPKEPDPVKLISSLFSPRKESIGEIISRLSDIYGPVDYTSSELVFDRTKYYAKEMGWPLYRRFFSFSRLIPAGDLVKIKLATNEIEKDYLIDGSRTANIDPGYVSPERLILATGKNYIHRVYLSKGIYADLTLLYKRGTFVSLEWTYPDYAESGIIDMFNGIRKGYMEQLREMKRVA